MTLTTLKVGELVLGGDHSQQHVTVHFLFPPIVTAGLKMYVREGGRRGGGGRVGGLRDTQTNLTRFKQGKKCL